MLNRIIFFSVLFLVVACDDDPQITTDHVNLEHITYAPVNYILEVDNPTFPQMVIPQDNPLTEEGIALGRRLFYDPILSADNTMSCASCHLQSGSFTDQLAVSTGIDGIAGTRSSMSLLNVGFYNSGLFWDGRSMTLEDQALLPVEDPIEMHHTWSDVVDDFVVDTMYQKMFRKAFGITTTQEITKELAAKAIAQFERTMISATSSKFDRVALAQAAFTDQEYLGFEMFFDLNTGVVPDAQCWHCHNAPLMTNNTYANNGLDFDEDFTSFVDNGRGDVTGIIAQNGEFRIPTLRNIEFTAPYMHDGRFETLEEVLDHYISGGEYSIGRHPLMDSINLNLDQKAAIIAFLRTLSDEDFINNESFSDPF